MNIYVKALTQMMMIQTPIKISQSLLITPSDFTADNSTYVVTIDYSGSWSGLTSCSVTLTDVRGTTYTFNETF